MRNPREVVIEWDRALISPLELEALPRCLIIPDLVSSRYQYCPETKGPVLNPNFEEELCNWIEAEHGVRVHSYYLLG
jgi:hypothetical protein